MLADAQLVCRLDVFERHVPHLLLWGGGGGGGRGETGRKGGGEGGKQGGRGGEGGKQGGRGGSLCATSDSNKHTSVDDGLYPGNHLMDVVAVLELLSKDLHFGGAS